MYALTEGEIRHFQEKGWVGPLDTFTVEELEPVKEYVETISEVVVSGNQPMLKFYNSFLDYETPRAHHFSCEPLARLLKDRRIVGRLNQLGEANLLLWKTNFFHKMPGQGGIGWHQAIDYFGHKVDEDVPQEKKTLHFPKDKSVHNFTIWLAIEDATLENGCLFFANGSHKHRFTTVRVPLSEGAFSALTSQKMSWQEKRSYSKSFDFNEEEWEIEPVPVKAGQMIIFTEKVMHSAPTNRSDQIRFGINARYLPPSVKIYPHREHGDYIDGTGHNLKKHFCILVSGRDEYGLNVVRDWPQDVILI